MSRGYTTLSRIESHLGRQLTTSDLDKASQLIDAAEHFIDSWCGRSWSGTLTITDELYGIEEHMQTVRDAYVSPAMYFDQPWLAGMGAPRYAAYWTGDVQLKGRPVGRIISVRNRPSDEVPVAPTTAPTVTTSATGGSIFSGSYQLAFSWIYDIGESEVSPSATVTTAGNTSTISITIPGLPAGATGAHLYTSQADGSTLYRANSDPLPASTVTMSSLPGTGQPNPVTYELDYSVINLSDGRIWIPTYYQNYYVWVTYTTLGTVPADIQEIATQIVANWLTRTSAGSGGINLAGTGPIRAYTIGNDLQVEFATATGKTSQSITGLPDTVMALLYRRKRFTIS